MKLAKLENLIGHRFSKPELLERAVTHRSWAHENMDGATEAELRELDNETFEFVGDSVLGLAIAEELFLRHPKLGEGDLTLMKHRLVSTSSLADTADRMKLGDFIRFGKGEERTGGRAKRALLANTLEAVIAAVFFDAGYVTARAFVVRIFADAFRKSTPEASLDYKTLLQETLQAAKLAAPTYSLLRSEGPPHERTFFVEAIWEGGRTEGTGRSRKLAEMMAASAALAKIEEKGGLA